MKKRERTAAALLAALCLTATACGGQPGPEEAVATAAKDLSAYAGCWKYDDMPFYMVINEDNEWVAINVYGDQVGPGAYTHEGDGITLSMDDGSLLTSFTPTDSGLVDADGNTLTAWDYIMLLPDAADDLNMTVNFPDSFANVTIQYPVQMNTSTIRSNMLATCSYTTDWVTAPKPVPTAAPATTTGTGSTSGTTGSDSGDYGTPYYWNDDDGDVWYWNGTYNEFIGYGDSYYIDNDGQYYESNDAGWEDDGYGDTFDYEEEYYEDYDPWSDPGDGWGDYDDYSYDDEGWGDYFD